jgi:hypothetical protein
MNKVWSTILLIYCMMLSFLSLMLCWDWDGDGRGGGGWGGVDLIIIC